MARIPTIRTKDQVAPEHIPIFEAIAASRGEVRGPFAVLFHSPEVAGRTAHLGAYLRFEGVLDDQTREIASMAAARELNCAYEWGAHVAAARACAVSEAVISAIRGRANAGLTTEVAQVVNYVQDLIRDHEAKEAVVTLLRERLGLQGLVELTATVGYYSMIGAVLNAFAVEPMEGADPLPL